MGVTRSRALRQRFTVARSKHVRAALALSLVLVAGVLDACGSSTSGTSQGKSGTGADLSLTTEPPQAQRLANDPAARRQVVARVGRHTFTRAYLEAWTQLEVVVASPYQHSSAVPTGFVPDPPSYRYCIAYLAAKSGNAHPQTAQFERQCAHQHQVQVQSTLSHLLRYAFSYEEAARKGIHVDAAEVRREAVKRGVRPGILRALGIPRSYQQFQIGAELSTAKLLTTLPAYKRARSADHETTKMADEVDNADLRFYQEMLRRWIPRTECAPGFIVLQCSAYSQESQL
jgi:hypothetical protein